MINHGMFSINGVIKRHSNIVAKVGDIIGIEDYYRDLVRHDVLLRYINNIIF
jgi:hypothetical protein